MFTLRDAAHLGERLAAVPGVAREATPIGLTLWKMWTGRLDCGGEEQVVDGVPEEVWTEGLAQTNTAHLAAWLSGRDDRCPTWTAWAGTDSPGDLPAEVESAAYDAVTAIWTAGVPETACVEYVDPVRTVVNTRRMLADRLDREAAALGMTRPDLVRVILEDYGRHGGSLRRPPDQAQAVCDAGGLPWVRADDVRAWVCIAPDVAATTGPLIWTELVDRGGVAFITRETAAELAAAGAAELARRDEYIPQ